MASESPQDVSEFARRIQKCEELAKGLAKDSLSERESERLLRDSQELQCSRLPTEEFQLQSKYKNDPEVLKSIDQISQAETPDLPTPKIPKPPPKQDFEAKPIPISDNGLQAQPARPPKSQPPETIWPEWLKNFRLQLAKGEFLECQNALLNEKLKEAPTAVARDAEFAIEDCAYRALNKEFYAYEVELKKLAPALLSGAKRTQTEFLKNTRKFCHPWVLHAQKCKRKKGENANPQLLTCRLNAFDYRLQQLQQVRKKKLQLSVNKALPDPKGGEPFLPFAKTVCELPPAYWLEGRKPANACETAISGDIGKRLRGLNQPPENCENEPE